MKQFLNKISLWILTFVTIFAVSFTASAQTNLLDKGTAEFSAIETLDGTYNTTYVALEDNPDAKAVFPAYTSVTPAAGSTVVKIETITLQLPNGFTVDRSATGVRIIIVNGEEVSVTTRTRTGAELIISLTKPLVADGAYEVIIPQGFVSAVTGEASPRTVLSYTVNSPYFELAADNFSPKPGSDIEINLSDPLNPKSFCTFSINYPDLMAGAVNFTYTSNTGEQTSVKNAPLTEVGSAYSLNFNDYKIEKIGTYTFKFPEGAFYTKSGKRSVAFQLVYTVDVKHYKYSVLLTAGSHTVPANATINVAGKAYKNGDVISVTSALKESDVQNAEIDGYILKGVEVVQPSEVGETTYNGAVIISYEKVLPRLKYTLVSPVAGNIDLDSYASLSTICLTFPEELDATYLKAPAGFSLKNPAGEQIALSQPYGYTGWAEEYELYINFPKQESLGTYTLDIPADVITFAGGYKNEAIHVEWTIKAQYFQFPYYDTGLVKEFGSFTLNAPDGTTFIDSNLNSLKCIEGYDPVTDEPIYSDSPVSVNLTATEAVVTLKNPIAKKGSFVIIIPEGCFTTADGRKNREFQIYPYVDPTEYINILSSTPANYKIVEAPFTSIVLNLDRVVTASEVEEFGSTIIYNWDVDLPVTASVNGARLTLTFSDEDIYYGGNYNSFMIPEGFLRLKDGSVNTQCNIYNVWVDEPKIPLELSGIQMGWGGEVVTTSGAEVEQVGVLLLQFPEKIALVDGADLTAITVTDGSGNPCALYFNYGEPCIYVSNDIQLFVWVNPAMTTVGTYTLHVPAGYIVGQESGNVNAEINFEFVISNIKTFVAGTDLKDGDIVDTLTELVLTAPAGVTFSHFTDYPANFFYLTGKGINGDGKIINQATVSADGKTATLRLGDIKTDGEYTITVPKGYLRSTTPNEGNAEIVLHVTVDHQVLAWDADGNGAVEVNDVQTAVNVALECSNGMGGATDSAALKALDTNGDGDITIGEIAKLIQQLQTAKKLTPSQALSR